MIEETRFKFIFILKLDDTRPVTFLYNDIILILVFNLFNLILNLIFNFFNETYVQLIYIQKPTIDNYIFHNDENM